MTLNKISQALILSGAVFLGACSDEQASTSQTKPAAEQTKQSTEQNNPQLINAEKSRLDIYTDFTLTSDLSHLSDNQKQMVGKLIDASKIMDELFWRQAFGDNKDAFLAKINDEKVQKFADINYGPWDRLNGDQVFLSGYEEKPLGAEFYPSDITKEELNNATVDDKTGLYSVIKRDEKGQLYSVAYSVEYAQELEKAANLLREASTLADDKEFANYLSMRAEALVSDDFQPSDFAWMDMKNNPIDVVIGPIETYEDQLFGYRAAYESYVLIKDLAWSERLAKFAAFLPELQKGLPVDEKYKQEVPGSDADLNAYDVVYYAGHSNAGSKTIAINLPNDEQVQLEKGTRRLQLKNAMRAKFDKILVPISEQLIVPEQRKHITFDAFFANTMFHEVAHGLGIKNTITGKGTVRQSLQEHASALEEGKADILGLYMVEQLLKKGEITEGTLEDYYITFMAGIFRSVRFGASSAHGKANMIRFNFFAEEGAFSKNADGLYSVNMEKMSQAMEKLSNLILTIQGDGDYQKVDQLIATHGDIKAELAKDLEKLSQANIPVDVTFKQGKEVLGL
ncbi:Zn-dependent hydrolase [Pseudoalteromonas shioyasakiensis]|mgnify:FL=1|uniref:dipeptidyl-peptidase 3 family protein n=1 Tax=Pseudoalteromonas TaxID=53246 RepID=UPI000C9193D9|nr:MULTISPECIES: Zn-dependent hydrolase [Pseudoalteromonas]MAD04277.1 Zn-dependent hydrolase [Pseudoalteromonas sp.]MCG9709744.1 Zn-dependent hydrolase [Pseudoalteromonas sp. Isolate3]MCQ8883143.1 Zn-dependent hydrolase [Pseudoalteromonas shioyasakiensis]NIZ05524.1 Zn-dependent hydrolase [Pseudoalteromonas sp. HF66]QLE08578.1 Zn-dependent hydrolase [Pseudoalteromonas shioyasakiensis]|tara:strand:- start:57550 stop:59250 length:1701 start_codon:yes stop_codon:yes gene_type:complete